MLHAHDDARARIKALRDVAQIYYQEAQLHIHAPRRSVARDRLAARYQTLSAMFYSLARVEYQCEDWDGWALVDGRWEYL